MINVREKISLQFRASYLAREKEYTREEDALYYSFTDGDPRKESARKLVLAKREMFYALWSYESNAQHFRESEKVKERVKVPSFITTMKDAIKLYFEPITRFIK